MRRPHQRVVDLFLTALAVLAFTSGLATTPSFAQAIHAPRLAPVDPPSDAASVRVEGHDPAAPRPLVLWRWRDGEFLRLAHTTSLPGGRFDFGQIARTAEGLDLQVSVRGRAPREVDRLRVEGPIAAPHLSPAAGPDGNRLFVRPARATGLLRVIDAERRTLIHQEPIEIDSRGRMLLDLDAVLAPRPPREILVEQVLPDGRVSDRTFFRLEGRAESMADRR